MAENNNDGASEEQLPFMQRLLDNPFVLLVLVWQAISSGAGLERFILPGPLDVWSQFKVVADDGSVLFTKERLEIRVRPMTDDELNRQFSDVT